jgi:hypothetical protein
MLRTLIAALLGLTATAQTQIDLSTQAKRVDFTNAISTRPIKTGVALPTACVTGEVFFNTAAVPGSNLYACTATNTWTVQTGFPAQNCWYNATAQTLQCRDSQGAVFTAVQASSGRIANQWVDYISGAGIPHTSQPTAASVTNAADTTQNYTNPVWISSLA